MSPGPLCEAVPLFGDQQIRLPYRVVCLFRFTQGVLSQLAVPFRSLAGRKLRKIRHVLFTPEDFAQSRIGPKRRKTMPACALPRPVSDAHPEAPRTAKPASDSRALISAAWALSRASTTRPRSADLADTPVISRLCDTSRMLPPASPMMLETRARSPGRSS